MSFLHFHIFTIITFLKNIFIFLDIEGTLETLNEELLKRLKKDQNSPVKDEEDEEGEALLRKIKEAENKNKIEENEVEIEAEIRSDLQEILGEPSTKVEKLILALKKIEEREEESDEDPVLDDDYLEQLEMETINEIKSSPPEKELQRLFEVLLWIQDVKRINQINFSEEDEETPFSNKKAPKQ